MLAEIQILDIMKTKKYMSLTVFAMLFVVFGCSEDVPTNEQQETTTSYSTKSAKQDELVEVKNFQNKLKEISRSGKQLTDSEKANLLFTEAKALLKVHGLPENTKIPEDLTTEEERTTYLGFIRFIELIKNK
ncbi:hypothetical protein CDL10_04865 [Avrilella dinanensis]|uniref:Uncharacterized protein n=2 Tax=Avrilella dinanensis TaxID=2008672 RepID=A0A2M9R4Y5_9FLAO|nr:hypothetical protein CDL10_04865 [Avrilella dinanensis]